MIAGAPKELGAEKERMVDGAAQWLPTESSVRGIKIAQEILRVERCADARIVVAARVRAAKVNVGRFAEVAVETNVADNTDVLPSVGGENITRIAPINLGRSLEEPILGGR